MLLSYDFSKANDCKYKLNSISIAANKNDSDFLHNLCTEKILDIENPALTFANKLNGGCLENISEDKIELEADICNLLSDLFYDENSLQAKSINIFQFLIKILEIYIRAFIEEKT